MTDSPFYRMNCKDYLIKHLRRQQYSLFVALGIMMAAFIYLATVFYFTQKGIPSVVVTKAQPIGHDFVLLKLHNRNTGENQGGIFLRVQ